MSHSFYLTTYFSLFLFSFGTLSSLGLMGSAWHTPYIGKYKRINMWIHLNINIPSANFRYAVCLFKIFFVNIKYFFVTTTFRSIHSMSFFRCTARLEKAEKWTKETVDSTKTGWFNQYYFPKTESILFLCTHKAKENRRMDRLKRCGIKEKPKNRN